MRETITTQDSLTEPEDRVMSASGCFMCNRSLRECDGLLLHLDDGRGFCARCARTAVSTHRELVEALEMLLGASRRYLENEVPSDSEMADESYKPPLTQANEVLAKAKVQP